MDQIDLAPAAERLAKVVGNITDEQLAARTPCPAYTVGDLLDHVASLSLAFMMAARKEPMPGDSQAPSGNASRLSPSWRTQIPHDLGLLAAAWREPEAWTGMTQAGGIDLPGEVAGLVALDEVVIHGVGSGPGHGAGLRRGGRVAAGRARLRLPVLRTGPGGAASGPVRP